MNYNFIINLDRFLHNKSLFLHETGLVTETD
jgi:hypothetical protein